MPQPYDLAQMPQRPSQSPQDPSPGQDNVNALSQAAARSTAMQGTRSQNVGATPSGKEVMQRPPTLQPIQGGLIDGQAVKTGINPENRNIKQTMGTGIIAAQMNRPV
jgi:hypothetical protein